MNVVTALLTPGHPTGLMESSFLLRCAGSKGTGPGSAQHGTTYTARFELRSSVSDHVCDLSSTNACARFHYLHLQHLEFLVRCPVHPTDLSPCISKRCWEEHEVDVAQIMSRELLCMSCRTHPADLAFALARPACICSKACRGTSGCARGTPDVCFG